MGLDRVVMLLINSADMSAAEAAGTARRSPATPRAGPPTGKPVPHRTAAGRRSVQEGSHSSAEGVWQTSETGR